MARMDGWMDGLPALGSPNEKKYMEVAAGVTKTCFHMYHDLATGIAPEFVNFQNRHMHAGRCLLFALNAYSHESEA